MSSGQPAASRRRVLVTGSAGAIGAAMCRALRAAGHFVRGFDLRPSPCVDEDMSGTLTDPAAIDRAVAGIQAVIHLAATPTDRDFMTDLLPNNIVGAYHICEAARKHRVSRLVLVSTAQVVGGLLRPGHAQRENEGVAPYGMYALTKLWMENLGELYARGHKLSVLAVRPGYLPRAERDRQNLLKSAASQQWYLSPGDAGRFACLAVTSPRPEAGQFEVVFLTSRHAQEPLFDLTRAREVVGYEPADTFPEGLDEAAQHWQG